MAETIYMIHGMWGGAYQWENYRSVFEARGYRCVATTLRHHGADPSAPPPPELGTTSLLDYAEDLEREVRALGEPPVLMGHSMGGLLAQMLAARGLGRRLVCLTPASPYGIIALRLSVIRSFWSGMTRLGFWRKPFRQTYGEAVYSMMHLLPEEERRRAYERFVYESGRATFEIGFWPLDLRRASRVRAGEVSVPVLVVAGGQDRITPAPVVRRVARRYGARAAFKLFPGHAHWVLAEPGWEEVAGFVADWLQEKAP
ncbi:MAG: alpha/beta hydrolase [Acidobacteriota bacterium]